MEQVLYYGFEIVEEGLETIRRFLIENEIDLIGGEQKEMHMTCEYFGPNPSTKTLQRMQMVLPGIDDIGKAVTLIADGYGDYPNDSGVILNQGLRISKDSLKKISLSDGRTGLELSQNEVPHITLSVNRDRDAKTGCPVAFAVDTAKCDFIPIKPFPIQGRVKLFYNE